jgi:hypothetical protein
MIHQFALRPSPASGRGERLPFRDWLRYAVLSLGLSPEAFWALTLAEWRLLSPDAPSALSRDGLLGLIAQYPDKRS